MLGYMNALQSFARPSKNAVSLLLKDHAFRVLCTKRENELPATP